ncbi:MAG: phosphoglucosamine mutase [Bacilli bacterium]|nr:phosphoglucosamine mutase [Bacilli bacterium]
MGKYFGTDGVRGVANKELTSNLAYKIGRFIGYFENGRKNKVLIARDTRLSGKQLADALGSGVTSSGSDVYDLGVSTTPSVSYLVQKHHFDFGVMISASHNPYYDNGIKIFNSKGEKLESQIEDLIEQYIDSLVDTIPLAVNENIGRYPECNELVDEYINFLVSKADKGYKGKVLIDCANGSSSALINKIVEKLGLNAVIVNAEPNGININDHCGSTHIELLKSELEKGVYDIAFAFDGDADRCLALDSKGNKVDGDAIMYLCGLNLKKHNKLAKDTIVLTVMSNIGLKIALKENNINMVEVSVGDKYVQAEMKKNKFTLGGEQSGHIIFLDDMNTGDGLLTMIKVLNVLKDEDESIDELIRELHIYPQMLKNMTVTNKEAILSHQGFIARINELSESLKGEGRILVRPSGTEPLIRVMCEAKTIEQCEAICDDLLNYISEII